MEFESSSVALDLRFVPDDMQFDTVTVRDSASAISSTYTPPTFIFKALQQTKVMCDILLFSVMLHCALCMCCAITYCCLGSILYCLAVRCSGVMQKYELCVTCLYSS
jgi:hypothetical protein